MNGPTMKLALPALISASLLALPQDPAAARDGRFDDPLFRQCISWMLDGNRGALIENRCMDEYAIPPPSLFSCARKVMTGFVSAADQEGCAIVFEEQARKVRAGYVK